MAGSGYGPLSGPSRFAPAGPVQAYQTYAIQAPKATHWRPATCAEVDCEHYLHGWRTVLDTATQGALVKAVRSSGRTPSAVLHEGTTITFVFEAGTTCFKASEHRVRLDRQALYLVRGGDWRGNPTGMRRQHTRPEHWVEDFAEHQDRLARRQQEG